MPRVYNVNNTIAERNAFPPLSETPETGHRLGIPQYVYDYDICGDERGLNKILDTINRNCWELVSVTYVDEEFFVFFRRRADG